MSFLTPLLLWGMALASAPIIIHLLFRRRFRRVDWAPMKYLKLSLRRNRRRIQLEQLLLLALRVAAVLALFFLVARPVLRAEGLLSRWIGGGRASRILLIDDSLSMGRTTQGRSALRRAQDLALAWLEGVQAQDRLTIALASNPAAPLLREVEPTDRPMLRSTIEGIAPTEVHVIWGRVLQAAGELVTSTTYPIREVVLITDLRRSGWDETAADAARTWAVKNVRWRIYDVGEAERDVGNLSLAELKMLERTAQVGTPVRWEATVHNSGGDQTEGAFGTLTVDGKSSQIRLPTIPAGQTVPVALSATFQESGLHEMSLALPDDILPGDNRRWSVVHVRELVRVVLVDGQPSSEPLGGDVDFLALALSVAAGDAQGWQVQIVPDIEWPAALATDPDLLILANVAAVTPAQATQLQRAVQAGMGLVLFMGGQVDPDNYNQTLGGGGIDLLPGRLDGPADNDRPGLIVADEADSPLAPLRQLSAAVLERIPVKTHMQLRIERDARDVQPLARWNDAEESPAIVAKRVGRGRVLLWTTSADKDWGDWPTEPSYVLAVREAARAVVRSDALGRDLTAGQPIRYPLPANEAAESATVQGPSQREPEAITASVVAAGERDVAAPVPPAGAADGTVSQDVSGNALVWTDTGRAGVYAIEWKDRNGRPQRDRIAVNPDARESDLSAINPDELRGLLAGVAPEIIRVAGSEAAQRALEGQEIWRTAGYLLMGLLVFESCFAAWTGSRR